VIRLLFLASFTLACTLFCLTVGGVSIPVASILSLPWRALPEREESVLLAIRLPRVLLAVLVGSGLGISGAAMQGLFRNPLVEPGLLGVSNGAALGAVLAIVLGDRIAHGLPPLISPYFTALAAFGGGFVAMLLVQRIARGAGYTSPGRLLVAGIAVNALAGAFTGLCTYVANDSQLRSLTFWSLGSLGGATWYVVLTVAPLIAVPVLLLPRFARALNALLLGDGDAHHLGFDVARTKRVVVLLVALIVGASVAVSGVLGFVGLVVPHIVRLLGGPDHRFALPASALFGASLLLLADAFARTAVVPAELPLGVVTACLGTPIFLLLLLRDGGRIA
jgi:iron complex transport system permease protein